jgi:hypothetical protein
MGAPRSLQNREELVGLLKALRAVPVRPGCEAEAQVLLHRQLGEHAPAFGNQRDAGSGDLLRASTGNRLAADAN